MKPWNESATLPLRQITHRVCGRGEWAGGQTNTACGHRNARRSPPSPPTQNSSPHTRIWRSAGGTSPGKSTRWSARCRSHKSTATVRQRRTRARQARVPRDLAPAGASCRRARISITIRGALVSVLIRIAPGGCINAKNCATTRAVFSSIGRQPNLCPPEWDFGGCLFYGPRRSRRFHTTNAF
jgi:hypothetical protein